MYPFPIAPGLNAWFLVGFTLLMSVFSTSDYSQIGRLSANIRQTAISVSANAGSIPDMAIVLRKIETDMVSVSGGAFTMGCKSEKRDGDCYECEKPPHEVRVAAFSIGRYEVTQAQWRAVIGSDPPELHNKGCDECPVEQVSWNDIQDFIQKLNALTGKRYRLPSEAEWEYAARGGNQSKKRLYSGSKVINEVAWYEVNALEGNTHGVQKTTRPVGTKKSNELGIFDMSGNVREWVEDCWHKQYDGAPSNSRAWQQANEGDCSRRVLRGGSWFTDGFYSRVSDRDWGENEEKTHHYGFRLAL